MKVLNFNSKQCERVRRQLDAYLSNELLVETTSEVLRHLESCEACSHELDARTSLRKALRKAADQRVPPEHLREAIRRRLRREQPGLFSEFRLMYLAVAGVDAAAEQDRASHPKRAGRQCGAIRPMAGPHEGAGRG